VRSDSDFVNIQFSFLLKQYITTVNSVDGEQYTWCEREIARFYVALQVKSIKHNPDIRNRFFQVEQLANQFLIITSSHSIKKHSNKLSFDRYIKHFLEESGLIPLMISTTRNREDLMALKLSHNMLKFLLNYHIRGYQI
jgi:hypothetical protein